jgi:hypothetical protein
MDLGGILGRGGCGQQQRQQEKKVFHGPAL